MVCATTNAPVLPSGGTACYNHVQDGQWLIVTGTQACGSSLDWASRLLAPNEPNRLAALTQLAQLAPAGSAGLVFFAASRRRTRAVLGRGADRPVRRAAARSRPTPLGACGFWRALRFRCSTRWANAPEVERGTLQFTVLGGGSRSALLSQILADVFGDPCGRDRAQNPPAARRSSRRWAPAGFQDGTPRPLDDEASLYSPDPALASVYANSLAHYRALHRQTPNSYKNNRRAAS